MEQTEQTTVPGPVPALPAPSRGLARLAPALALALASAPAPALAPGLAPGLVPARELELSVPPADPQQSTVHSSGNTLRDFSAHIAIPWQ